MFEINVKAFLDSLSIMGMGMLGIFIVTGLIILTVVALNFFTKPKREPTQADGSTIEKTTKKLGGVIAALFCLIVVVGGIALIYVFTKS